LQLDAICDRFEQAYGQDSTTRIEDFANLLNAEQQQLVIPELAAIEWPLRIARHESISGY